MPRTAIPNEETVAPARRPHIGALSSSSLLHASDERLVSLTRGGSERAFAEITRRYQRPLYVYCIQILGAGRAEDAVQQTFLKAFVALRDGADREIALRPWLYRIARNCSIDLLRSHGSDHAELDPDYDGLPQPVAWAAFEQKEELTKLVAAIQALPEGQRRALTLRELEGRSYGEISAVLGHSHSGVRQLIFRARTTLRNLAALALPVGSLRSRLLGQFAPGVHDPNHVAAAASLSPAGGGGAFETVGAILAATATLAAGAGATAPKHADGQLATPAYAAPLAAAPGMAGSGLGTPATHAGLRSARTGGARADASPRTPAPAAAVPVIVSAPIIAAPPPSLAPIAPPPPSLADVQPAAPATPAAGGGGVVASPQSVNSSAKPAPAGGTPMTNPSSGSVAPPASGVTGPGGLIPAKGGAGGQVHPVKPVAPKKAPGGAGTQSGPTKPVSPKPAPLGAGGQIRPTKPASPKSPRTPKSTKAPPEG